MWSIGMNVCVPSYLARTSIVIVIRALIAEEDLKRNGDNSDFNLRKEKHLHKICIRCYMR